MSCCSDSSGVSGSPAKAENSSTHWEVQISACKNGTNLLKNPELHAGTSNAAYLVVRLTFAKMVLICTLLLHTI